MSLPSLTTARQQTHPHHHAPPEHNRLGLNFRQPIPKPNVRGRTIDFHTHLLAARHAPQWFQAMDHYGFDHCFTMTPLEEALTFQRDWPGRVHFIAIPRWGDAGYDDWMRRIDAFYNLGSRIVKFHMAPRMIHERKWRFDVPEIRKILHQSVARNMLIMSHIGDPDIWYAGKYSDAAKFGTRQDHYKMWEDAMADYPHHPWLAAHMGGNPENLPRLQDLLDRYPNLYLDCSATRWIIRELSVRRDQARDFFIRNQDRIIFGTDQVSGDNRDFDFLASRYWCHRMMWETDYVGPSPIVDPDLPADNQPVIRGLALPDVVLQKLYRDNAVKLMSRVGVKID